MIQRIKSIIENPLARRILWGVFANVFAQFVVIFTQLLLVPMLSNQWGQERYGVWLLLFTVPSYLALGDFGFGTAAGIRMTMEVANGRNESAVATFQSAAIAIGATTGVLGIIGVLAISILPVGNWASYGWTASEMRLTAYIVYIYGLVCLFSSLPSGGFRSVGLYALGTSVQAGTMATETLVAVAITWWGGGIIELGIGYLVTRSSAIAFQWFLLRRRVPWLVPGFSHASRGVIRELLKPASAVMAMPFAQALVLQGTALTVGIILGPAAVAGFTTVRTLVRTGVQLTTLLNHAVMPEMSVAVAKGKSRAIRRIVLLTLGGSLLVVAPGAIILLAFGQDIIRIWTRGSIHVDTDLLHIMIVVMVVNGIWHPLSNLIMSINRQSSYSYMYAIAAIVTVLISAPLCYYLGVSGGGVALLLLDIYMSFWIFRLIPHLLLRRA